MIAKTAIIYPNVKLGANVVIEDYCIVGAPLKDGSEPETVIGSDSYLRSFTVIYAGNQIGHHFQTGNKANIRENNKIGNHVSIGALTVIEHKTIIEDNVRIHTNSLICEFSVLKKGCWIGPHVVFTNAKVPLSPDAKNNLQGPIIEEKAIIGGNVTISPGVVVQANALVGSGSNITKSISKDQIAYGNPAVEKRKR